MIEHSTTQHQGLWFYCNDEEVGCLHFDQDPTIIINGGVPDWHYAVFGLYVCGVGFQFFAFMIFWFIFCKQKNTKCYRWHNVFSLVGWIALVCGMSLYTYMFLQRMEINGYKWGYSFGFGWLSALLHFLSLILSFMLIMMDHRRNDPYSQSFN
uniref:Uncharacterized protein n=2 Tax=Clytia hemisphaerica TaxID=252671 RepID=A0A7M5WQC3_9CNID